MFACVQEPRGSSLQEKREGEGEPDEDTEMAEKQPRSRLLRGRTGLRDRRARQRKQNCDGRCQDGPMRMPAAIDIGENLTKLGIAGPNKGREDQSAIFCGHGHHRRGTQ